MSNTLSNAKVGDLFLTKNNCLCLIFKIFIEKCYGAKDSDAMQTKCFVFNFINDFRFWYIYDDDIKINDS
jgi:hypothetical protein